MNAQLRAWLLEGEDLPAKLDAERLLADDAEAAALMADLERVDLLAKELGDLEPPPALNQQILDAIAREPSRGATSLADLPNPPKPANRTWILAGLAAVVSVAAVGLLSVAALPTADPGGNPADWTPRGDEGAGPGVDLRVVVKLGGTTAGIERLRRGETYQAGDTLLFRYDAHAAGYLALVRVDTSGAEVVHLQQVGVGPGDLETTAGLVGYELEKGESTAVFALLRSDRPLAENELRSSLADIRPDEDAVCAAALGLGARCAAETIEEVP